VPLMAMLRHRAAAGSDAQAVLLVSSRTEQDILYRAELDRLAAQGNGLALHHTLTRGAPGGWQGFDRRVDAEMLTAVGPAVADAPRTFVCGPTPFVEAVADLLVGLGHEPASIHAERFGPTGG
jgi:ferredoxin-NADP reductase